MTDEQLKKALEYCSTNVRENTCPKCAFYKKHRCSTLMLNAVSDLINRQKAEIERLKVDLEFKCDSCENIKLSREEYRRLVLQAKSEAIKEFAEKLKEENKPWLYARIEDIDNLVKEMTEVQE